MNVDKDVLYNKYKPHESVMFLTFCGILRVKGESSGGDEEERDPLSRERLITLRAASGVDGDNCTGTDALWSGNGLSPAYGLLDEQRQKRECRREDVAKRSPVQTSEIYM